MDQRVISCDDHLDLAYLPADFWTRNMARSMLDRAPHVEERNGQPVWICDGRVWGGWRGTLGKGGAPKPLSPIVTARYTLDRTVDAIAKSVDRTDGKIMVSPN